MGTAIASRPRAVSAASPRDRIRVRLSALSLAVRFVVAALLVFAVATVIIGSWVGAQIETGVLNRTAAVTALYVDSVLSPQLQSLARSKTLDTGSVVAIDQLLDRTAFGEHIVALKVWGTDGTILYSPNRALIGRSYPVESGLARSVAGDVVADITDLSEVENVYERARWSRLVEVYAPVFADHGGPLIAVTEFYQLPDALEDEVRSAQIGSWAVVALTMLAAYALLAGIVRAGSDTIVRQSAALRARVNELQVVLAENRRLQARVAQAARSTTASNEQFLKRISADLHDGPAQALGLALLRLDEMPSDPSIPAGDVATVRHAIGDALAELRSIASGLRSPELESYSLVTIAERAVRDHERRSGTHVELVAYALPERAPLAIKIALHRILQEALSNATRHGRPTTIRVELSTDGVALDVSIRDDGAGFTTGRVKSGLGITGMRERAELLGGSFSVEGGLTVGTRVHVSLPLVEGVA